MAHRDITPYKGGRSTDFRAKMTPSDKQMLCDLAAEHKVSMADIVITALHLFRKDYSLAERQALVTDLGKDKI